MTESTTTTGTGRRSSTAERVAAWLIGAFSTAVIAFPLVQSFGSLTDWARDALDLEGPFAWGVPLSLDFVAAAFMALALHSVMRAESAALPRLLVWVMVAGSSLANWRHGSMVSTDAAVYFAAMPIIAGVLLDLILRRVRRVVLGDLDAVEPPLPRYRAARWLVAPRETFRAWKVAVREGITSPTEALVLARSGQSVAPAPDVAEALAEHEAREAEAAELAGMSKVDAIRRAFDALGHVDGPEALTWLAQRGVTVSATHAHDVARRVRDAQDQPQDPQDHTPPALVGPVSANGDRPALAAVATGTEGGPA